MNDIKEKAKQVRLLILDIDGILTSGKIYYGNEGEIGRDFHVHDGFGIRLLQKSRVDVAVISAKKSASVIKRLKDLEVLHTYLGYEDKLLAYMALKAKLHLADEAIAYMGDDLADLPLLKRVGLAITVPDAYERVLSEVHYVTQKKAGEGAVREICDMLMKAHHTYDAMLNEYLNP